LNILLFGVLVLALLLFVAWGTAGVLYPLWARLSAFRPSFARRALVGAAVPYILALGFVGALVLPAQLERLFVCHSGPGWLHLCWCHPGNAMVLLPPAVAALALLIPGRVRGLSTLFRVPRGDGGGATPVLADLLHPAALLVGWWRPSLVVDRRLWMALSSGEREAMLAHEQAHLDRRDPMMLFVLRVLTVIAPVPARRALVRAWLDRAEARADELAVQAVGDPLLVAEALLRCARLGARAPDLAIAWTSGQLERRVHAILKDAGAPAGSAPDANLLDGAVLLGMFLAVVAATPTLHHQLEHFLSY
jgi:Zn-dependent protease with chaperone function